MQATVAHVYGGRVTNQMKSVTYIDDSMESNNQRAVTGASKGMRHINPCGQNVPR